MNQDSIVISPDAWKLFTHPTQYPNNRYNIVFSNLDDIAQPDYSNIIAYIGRLSTEQLSFFSEKLRWLQIPSHGYNGFDNKNLYKNPDIVVSCVKDIFSEPIAQYCITAYFLFNTYSFRKKGAELNRCHITPLKPTILIMGIGNIGQALAKKCKQLGWTVYGVKRTIPERLPDYADGLCRLEDISKYIGVADYVVNILPEQNSSIGLFDYSFFKMMNSDALFCNVGRKSAVVDADLSKAVKSGVIRGAILDAHNEFDYDTPDIILTGHSSSVSADNDKNFDKYFAAQLNAFLTDAEIKNKIILKEV